MWLLLNQKEIPSSQPNAGPAAFLNVESAFLKVELAFLEVETHHYVYAFKYSEESGEINLLTKIFSAAH